MGQGLGPIRFLFAASAAPAPDLHVEVPGHPFHAQIGEDRQH